MTSVLPSFSKKRLYSGLILLLFILVIQQAIAQEENNWATPPVVNITGFVDVYYAYDFNKPTTPYRQPFFYNHNRQNEFNLNLGLLGLHVDQVKYRAILTMQVGTYTYDIAAAEQSTLKNVFEAYAGVSLNKKNNLWLDVGIFLSHLGVESPVSIGNWTLTRSIAIENLPYYLAGARLTYKPNDKIELMGLICNGWQRIQRVPGNSLPGYGTQVLVTPNEKYKISWGSFIGTDDPDSTRRMMIFNDFYGVMQFTPKFGISAGFDIGARQKDKGRSSYDIWYTYTLIAQFKFSERWATALRGEYYYDEQGVIISIENSPYGFKTSGFSLNLDYTPIPQLACRIEGRWLHGQDDIYTKENLPTPDNFFIVGSIAVKFDHKL